MPKEQVSGGSGRLIQPLNLVANRTNRAAALCRQLGL